MLVKNKYVKHAPFLRVNYMVSENVGSLKKNQKKLFVVDTFIVDVDTIISMLFISIIILYLGFIFKVDHFYNLRNCIFIEI